MGKYFKINEIAKFFNINTSRLRFYEDYGLITPALIDEYTHYRYYDLSNINTLAYIIDLKNAGMNMKQIKDYIAGKYSEDEFLTSLNDLKSRLEKLIKLNEQKNVKEDTFVIEEIEIEEFKYFTKICEVQDLEDIYNKYYEFLLLCVDECIIADNFAGFIEFETIEPSFETQNVRFGMHIKKSKDKISIFPNTKAIHTFYKGDYENITKAYNALKDYAIKNKITLKGNSLEVYHESFNLNKKNREFLTEVIFPIE